jgi:hypothetical protein
LTFKDLKKRFSDTTQLQQLQTRLFDICKNKPFWIWNVEEHKQEDIRTKGSCCFNYIIGLPQKNGLDKPLYDYEKIIFDSLVSSTFPSLYPYDTQNDNANPSPNQNPSNKHLWIKKATGLV